MASSDRAMRPFWIHQLAEYVIGIALVAQALQGIEPLVPALAGGLIVLNAAVAVGPLGAFRLVGRRLHRILDLVVIGILVVATFQPWISVDGGSRLVMGLVVVVLGFVWFYTDYAEKAARAERRAAQAGPTGEQIGRGAGRLAAGAVKEWKRRTGSE